ncbi:hypothetical protein PCANC_25486, partial [Puccinia coronata f. sp. avenae]
MALTTGSDCRPIASTASSFPWSTIPPGATPIICTFKAQLFDPTCQHSCNMRPALYALLLLVPPVSMSYHTVQAPHKQPCAGGGCIPHE